MSKSASSRWQSRLTVLAAALVASGVALGADVKVTLTGDQEVPAVKSEASGAGTITVRDDKTITGSVTTKGISGTAAHIHQGAAGKSGGVIIPLTKGADGGWSVPAGTKLSDVQLAAFKAGDLYVNVHSAAHPDGEIRGQIKPG